MLGAKPHGSTSNNKANRFKIHAIVKRDSLCRTRRCWCWSGHHVLANTNKLITLPGLPLSSRIPKSLSKPNSDSASFLRQLQSLIICVCSQIYSPRRKKQNRLSATKCNGLRDFCCLGFPVEPKKALCLAHFRHERCKVSENLFVLQKPKQSHEKVRRKLSGFHTEMTKNSRRC